MKRKTSFGSRLCVLLTQEWFGTGSVGARPRNSPSDRLSVHRHEIARCDFRPSKYPTNSIRKKTPGGTPGRPIVSA